MAVTTSKMEAFYLCQKQARGDLGKTLVADQINNTAGGIGVVDDVSEFGYTRQGGDDQNGLFTWRSDFDDNDEIKRVTTVTPSIGRVQVESAWNNVANFNYILIGIHPHKVLDAMDAGYSRMSIRKDVVMTLGSDLDMERDDADYWDDYRTNCDVIKEEAEPQNKVTGDFSLKLTLTAASGKILGPPIRITPGEHLTVAPCLRVVGGGPFTVRLWDTSNGAYFGDTQTYSGAEFAYLFIRSAVIPDDCFYWQVEIAGTDNGAIAWLDSVAARTSEQSQFELPEWLDETYKLPLIHRVNFKASIAGVSNQYAAPARQFAGDLVLDTHYHVQAQGTEARMNVLDFEPQVELGDDIFYLATRKDRNVVEPWATKDALTTAPRGELTAYLMYEISSLLYKETRDPYWDAQHTEWGLRLGAEVKPRTDVAYQPPRVTLVVKAGGGSW